MNIWKQNFTDKQTNIWMFQTIVFAPLGGVYFIPQKSWGEKLCGLAKILETCNSVNISVICHEEEYF